MNIFFIDRDLKKCAESYVDNHVIKIITEINQCLASAHPKGIAPYKWAYHNHPMTVWCRSSVEAYLYAVEHGLALCEEYTYRYSKEHKGEQILQWYKNNIPDLAVLHCKTHDELLFDASPPPRCFGKYDIPITDNIILDYRNYYHIAKSHLFKWKGREKPEWLR